MTCHNCENACKRFGKTRSGLQRYRCESCRKNFQQPRPDHLDGMYLPMEKAEEVLRLLLEGMSVASAERVTGVHHTTILKLLVLAGDKCEWLMAERVKAVPVKDVQCDELWSYVGMKDRHAPSEGPLVDVLGDAWVFVALERRTKLVLAWHVGRRTTRHTYEFMDKLNAATSGRFQITTDGFAGYTQAVGVCLGERTDFAQLVKIYSRPRDGEQRYSPAAFSKAIPTARYGRPDPQRISTSHVERQNLSLRMGIRRFTRLTNGFSKKWENHRAAVSVWYAYYNFCRKHTTIKTTPAMASGLTDHQWAVRELLEVA